MYTMQSCNGLVRKEGDSMYIVTNATPEGNYRPSIFSNLQDARDWMYSCTANNLKLSCHLENIPQNLNYKKICEWCEKNQTIDCEIYDDETRIYYSDDTFNIMQIFEVEV